MAYIPEASNDAKYVNRSGDTMTGALLLPNDPTNHLGVPNKLYVDEEFAGISRPKDQGLIVWNFPPLKIYWARPVALGTVYYMRFRLPKAATLSGIAFYVQAGGNTMLAGQNWAGLYNSSLARVAVSADIPNSTLTAVGPKKIAFTSTYSAAIGFYYAALLFNSNNYGPEILAADQVSYGLNMGLVAMPTCTYRFAADFQGQATLPNPTVSSNLMDSDTAYWIGIY